MSGTSPDSAISLPAPPLRPYIARYAGFRANGLPGGNDAGLPSRHVDLIISFANPFDIVRMPSPAQRPAAFRAFASGLQDAPAAVRRESSVHGLHLFFTPPGVRAILGVSNTELVSRVVDFTDIWGRRAARLIERLAEAPTWPRRFAILDQEFAGALTPVLPRPEVGWAWSKLMHAREHTPIPHLAREIGWSRRHFGEQFRTEYGISPKTAARIFRFERACRLMKDHRPSLVQVACAAGYYDQAHMTREWQALAGCSPKTWIARELPFLQDYELGGGDHQSIVA
jgi:AraC-like DNA-binding protein